MKFRVISLDLWNTIIDSSNTDARRAHRISGLTRLLSPYVPDMSKEKSEQLIKEQVHWFDLIWKNEHRTPVTADLTDRILDRVGLTGNQELRRSVTDLFEEGILVAPPALTPGLADVLPVLASEYRIGIISDTHFSPGRVVLSLLERYEIRQYFSFLSFSDENGVSKPHPAMYHKIADSAGIPVTDLLHIGDMERTDITGARAIGAGSILYAGANLADLKSTTADAVATHWNQVPDLIHSIENRRLTGRI